MEGFVVEQVSKTYMDEKQRPFQVLRDVSFSWSTGENIAVLGAVSYTHLDVYKRQEPGHRQYRQYLPVHPKTGVSKRQR